MRKAYRCVLPLLMALSFGAAAAVPDDWKHTAYAYEANQAPLATVLGDFTTAFGVKLDCSLACPPCCNPTPGSSLPIL